MKVRIYTKQDKVKLIEADIPILEYLILRDALTDYCKNETYSEPEKELAVQMLLDMDPYESEVIEIEDMT
jgi:hypothetical protein